MKLGTIKGILLYMSDKTFLYSKSICQVVNHHSARTYGEKIKSSMTDLIWNREWKQPIWN